MTTTRTSQYLNNFVTSYIERRNIIVSDGWSGYSFFIDDNSGYTHLTFNHGHGNFGHGVNSTSHIEGLWSYVKSSIKKIYHNILTKGLLYFIKESELMKKLFI